MGQNHDWFAPDVMKKYFKQLHSRIDNFDEKQMESLLYKPECEFEEAANQFRLIDDQTISVLINWRDSLIYYEQLITYGPSYSLMKKLAKYSVSIREPDFKRLQDIGAIEEPYENMYVVKDSNFYKAGTGLTISNQWIEETYII